MIGRLKVAMTEFSDCKYQKSNKRRFLLGTLFFCIAVFSGFFFRIPQAHAGYFDYSDVILVINDNSATSTTIGNYFKTARGIPDSQVVHISASTAESVNRTEFTNNVRTPVENFLTTNGIASSTNYIITTKGVPLKVSDNQNSVESELGLVLGRYASNIGGSGPNNPYFNAATQFSSATYGFYITTRLDGYTINDVQNLIDRSANATTTNAGSFVLDVQPNRDSNAYRSGNDWMRSAAPILTARGYNVTLDETSTYLTYRSNLSGYYSWGSNDGSATTTYSIPHNTYLNGSIAETIVSTGARSFMQGTTYGQSLIADLIAEGVSGVKGYVSEPGLSAIAHADILFGRYTQGYTMADSFFAASAFINWKDVVIGDPKMVIVKTPIPFDVAIPATNTISATQTPTFTWGDSDAYYGISKYQLFVDGVLNKDNITGTSTSPTGNLSAGTHTWYVKAVDTVGGVATSTSTFTVNIVPGYTSSYTFYVDNVLGSDSNPGTQVLPWATLGKAGTTVVAGNTVVIIKNVGVPYRETLNPSNSGTSGLLITFRGVDASNKPEIWGSTDISSGWSVYSGGNADTYQQATTTTIQVLAAGPSVLSLTKKTRGSSATTLNPGEWFLVSNVLYYRLAIGEAIGSLQVEASTRPSINNNGSINYISYQDIVARYAQTYAVSISGTGISVQRVEAYESQYGIFVSGNTITVNYVIGARNKNYGLYLSLPVSSSISNSTFYGNTTGGAVIYEFPSTSITFRNNIFSSNGNPSIVINTVVGPGTMTASNNLWDVAGDSTWDARKGTNNQELADPLLVDPSTSNFTLQSLSPNIDTGTSISGFTTDILGNPIYGTPDIGPYEYQPPYTIGTHDIDITGAVRLYKNGKYRYTNATTTGTTASFNITPVGGFPTGDYSEFLNMNITTWNTSGDYAKTWTETSTTATSTLHTIGNLKANTYYNVLVDSTQYASVLTNGSGQATFTYIGGYSTHTFDVAEDTDAPVAPTATPAATISSSSQTFVWSAASDPAGIAKYQLYTDGALKLDDITGTQTTATGFSCGTHAWYIRAIDNAGNTTDSSTQSFDVTCGGGPIMPAGTVLFNTPKPRMQTITNGIVTYLDEQASALATPSATPASSATQSITSSFAPSFSRTMTRGAKGNDIKMLQELLKKDPAIYPEGLVTGYFGPMTERAIRRFQKKYHIVSSGTPKTTGYGVVGPRTRVVLNNLSTI